MQNKARVNNLTVTGLEIWYVNTKVISAILLKFLHMYVLTLHGSRIRKDDTIRRVYHIVTDHAFWVESIVTYHRIYRKKCIT